MAIDVKHYIISLEASRDRLEKSIPQLKAVGVSPTVVRPEKSTHVGDERYNNAMDSLRLTTLKIIREAKARKGKFVHIWEDDTVINVKNYLYFKKKFPLIAARGFDFLHLNYSGGNLFELNLLDNCFRKSINGVECCQSYIINSSVFDLYITLLENEKRPIDTITRTIHIRNGNSYIVEPKPVSHTPHKFSTLRQKIVKY